MIKINNKGSKKLKKLIALTTVLIISVFVFCGCDNSPYVAPNGNLENGRISFIKIGKLNDYNDIVYDKDTFIVYIKGKDGTYSYGINPYYAKNGLPYRYIDSKFTEIK